MSSQPNLMTKLLQKNEESLLRKEMEGNINYLQKIKDRERRQAMTHPLNELFLSKKEMEGKC